MTLLPKERPFPSPPSPVQNPPLPPATVQTSRALISRSAPSSLPTDVPIVPPCVSCSGQVGPQLWSCFPAASRLPVPSAWEDPSGPSACPFSLPHPNRVLLIVKWPFVEDPWARLLTSSYSFTSSKTWGQIFSILPLPAPQTGPASKLPWVTFLVPLLMYLLRIIESPTS